MLSFYWLIGPYSRYEAQKNQHCFEKKIKWRRVIFQCGRTYDKNNYSKKYIKNYLDKYIWNLKYCNIEKKAPLVCKGLNTSAAIEPQTGKKWENLWAMNS